MRGKTVGALGSGASAAPPVPAPKPRNNRSANTSREAAHLYSRILQQRGTVPNGNTSKTQTTPTTLPPCASVSSERSSRAFDHRRKQKTTICLQTCYCFVNHVKKTSRPSRQGPRSAAMPTNSEVLALVKVATPRLEHGFLRTHHAPAGRSARRRVRLQPSAPNRQL